MSSWNTVPVHSLPAGALDLNTYAPNETECVKGHRFASEADCILPEDEVDAWDYFLCRRCVEDLKVDEPATTLVDTGSFFVRVPKADS